MDNEKELRDAIANPRLRALMIENIKSRAERQAVITVVLCATFLPGVFLLALSILFEASGLILIPAMLIGLSVQPLRECYTYWQTLKSAQWALEDGNTELDVS